MDAALEPEPVRARLAPNSPEPVRTSFFGPIALARLKELPLPGSPGIIASPIRRGRGLREMVGVWEALDGAGAVDAGTTNKYPSYTNL